MTQAYLFRRRDKSQNRVMLCCASAAWRDRQARATEELEEASFARKLLICKDFARPQWHQPLIS
jgi:hypothetical protein